VQRVLPADLCDGLACLTTPAVLGVGIAVGAAAAGALFALLYLLLLRPRASAAGAAASDARLQPLMQAGGY
jgi:hypothetical protein